MQLIEFHVIIKLFSITLEPTHAPVNIDAVPITNSSNVAISWGPPQMNDGAPIEGYTIFYWMLDNKQNQRNGSQRVDILSFSYTFNVLIPQSRYLFQVCTITII